MTNKEKIEEAKRLYQTANADQKYVLERLFPELQESEDERIRNDLIRFLDNLLDLKDVIFNQKEIENCKQFIAWLEKQGRQKVYTFKSLPRLLDMIEPTNKAMAYCQKLIDTLVKERYVTDAKIVGECLKIMNGNDVPMAIMDEKQDEQKPTDKIEPKFKVGDWVTNSIETVQITGYDIDYGYQVDYKGNLQHRDTDFIEKEYHLWKIQDAKDGDALATKWGAFIVKEYLDIINPDGVIAYCGINSMGRFDKCDGIYPWTDEKITPATKEERKLLFQKMKEAGYVWDDEKKELSRIEHKIAESEDERIRKDIISYLQHEYLVKKNVSDVEFDKWIAWIKKQGEYQPKLNDEDKTEVIKCLING